MTAAIKPSKARIGGVGIVLSLSLCVDLPPHRCVLSTRGVPPQTEAAKLPTTSAEDATMKVGLFINTQFPEGTDVAGRVPEIVEQVRAARAAGFSSLWFPH